MARDKKPPEPGEDIPAWFMTYSDVITLLMTFFILLLTFATTEPERFEKSVSSAFSGGAATGTAGVKLDDIEKDAWINRRRPPAARIAMRGAEMPPIMRDPTRAAFGEGIRSLDENEEKQNALTSHSFDIPAVELFNTDNELTSKGKQICAMLSAQLQDLPFQAAVQFADVRHIDNLAKMMEYLFHTEKTRPGQVSMNLVRQTGLAKDNIRITINRFSPNAEQLR